jgi:DNA-binding transcriptional LysR family regulator
MAQPQRLNHRQLEAFQAVVQLGSATAARDYLGITQPAVSRLIAALESTVGFALFERHRKGLRPTPDGKLFYDEVQRSYVGLHRIQDAAEAIRNQRTGRLRLAAMAAYADGFLAEVVGEYLCEHPGVHIELEALRKVDIVDGILGGQHDLGVCALPVNSPGLKIETITTGTAVCISPAKHRFSTRRSIPVSELAEESLIMLTPGSPLRHIVQSRLDEQGVRPRVIAEVGTQTAIFRMVAAGAGVAVVDSIITREMDQTRLSIRPLAPRTDWTIAAIVSARKRPSTTTAALIKCLRRRYAGTRSKPRRKAT